MWNNRESSRLLCEREFDEQGRLTASSWRGGRNDRATPLPLTTGVGGTYVLVGTGIRFNPRIETYLYGQHEHHASGRSHRLVRPGASALPYATISSSVEELWCWSVYAWFADIKKRCLLF